MKQTKRPPTWWETVKALYLIVYFGLIMLPRGVLQLLFEVHVADHPPRWLTTLAVIGGLPLLIAGLVWLGRQEKQSRTRK